jgi:hypothetical protein
VSDDDVIDAMVMEAVALKARQEDANAEKEAQKRAWRSTKNKGNYSDLDQFR